MKIRDYSYTDKNLVLIPGYGNLPANCALKDDYSVIVITLLVDITDGMILDATVNTISELSIAFITAQMIGRNIVKDSEVIIEGLGRYQAPAQKSLIVAYKSALDRYVNYIKGLK